MKKKYFRTPAPLPFGAGQNRQLIGRTEWGFYLECRREPTQAESAKIEWDLAETFEPENFSTASFLESYPLTLEVGPRPNILPAWSSTKLEILQAYGVSCVRRIIRSLRIGLVSQISEMDAAQLLKPLHDRMTQMRYLDPLAGFGSVEAPRPVRVIDVMSANWKANLLAFAKQSGLGWDAQDLEYIRWLAQDVVKRNLTDVELFSRIGQGNSEHCRHWRFKGIWKIDGMKLPYTLMKRTKQPLQKNPGNSVLAFCDDSSASQGGFVDVMIASDPAGPSRFKVVRRLRHPTCTAETHNHPSLWEPYEGEQTLQGIFRDEECIGRGGEIGIAANGQALGNLHIPGYVLPWEEDGWEVPPQYASSLQIANRGTSGAFDAGNCFGHPVTFGFFRTAGLTVDGKYRSWFKPVAYGAVGGSIDDAHLLKQRPAPGMLLGLMGGPAYRIGVGGGSGSSRVGGESDAELDFNSVQRGDAYRANILHRAVRACTELLDQNPIVTIHDLGAGGFGGSSHEIAEGTGAHVQVSKIPCADPTLSVLEIDANESQERNLAVFPEEARGMIEAISKREGCEIAFVGKITDTGRFVLEDDRDGTFPVDLPLRETLAELPQKTFIDTRLTPQLEPLVLPKGLTMMQALDRVLRLPSVASKRWLTSCVDRSVTGLVAQQQCVGPNHLPISDFSIKADSYFGYSGCAYALGEQPLKGLISPRAMVRMAVGESILNMAGARVVDLSNVKGSANWMLAVSLPGHGAWLCDGVDAVAEFWEELGIAADGGKDSLSLAVMVKSPSGEDVVVAGPGQFVFCAYARMADIRCKATADLKRAGRNLALIDLSGGHNRLGGSALAQVFGQVGNESPDVEDAELLKHAFRTVQGLVSERLIHSVHDRSDGGLVAVLEMAFAGNLGLDVNVQSTDDPFCTFFSEELGLVVECEDEALWTLEHQGIPHQFIGAGLAVDRRDPVQTPIILRHNGQTVLEEPMTTLRAIWEETSFQLDAQRTDATCVEQERLAVRNLVVPPPYRVTHCPLPTSPEVMIAQDKPIAAVWRERGSNGDRELAAAFMAAGFEVWDVTTSDLLAGRITLNRFQMLAVCGGFSFADVGDSAKGWAGVCRFNPIIAEQLERFRKRKDTLSFWVCNGEQLAPLLGWVPWQDLPDLEKARFIRNKSGRFQSRFPAVRVLPNSKAVMLKGMEGSILGVWVAHGEGQLHLNAGLLEDAINEGLVPLCYVDPRDGHPTEVYSFNPNGSPLGVAGLCSADGRHLAMMPHPERTFLSWQWPWLPPEFEKLPASPWLQMYQNAYQWCRDHS